MAAGITSAGPAQAAELHEVYAAVFGRPPFNESPSEAARWRDESLPKHAARAGFRMRAAREDGRLVGFAYGYTGERGQWWTDQMAAAITPEVAASWLGGHFEFVTLAVLPTHERQGIGTALHDALLADLPHRTALLTTTADETAPARRLYHRQGWQLLAAPVLENAALLGKRLKPT